MERDFEKELSQARRQLENVLKLLQSLPEDFWSTEISRINMAAMDISSFGGGIRERAYERAHAKAEALICPK